MKVYGVLLLFVSVISPSVLAASFDCQKAKTFAEKMICQSPRLSELDVELDRVFDEATFSEITKSEIVKDQINWLTKTRARCKDASCLEGMYEERIKYLGLFVIKNPPDQEDYILVQSTEEPNKSIAQGAELVLISGYEPAGETVEITVDRPNASVILVLSSYARVRWKVRSTPNTTIKAILVGGYESPTVSSPKLIPTYFTKIPYATDENNIKFKSILMELKRLFSTNHVDYFIGSYKIATQIVVSPVDSVNKKLSLDWPPVEKPTKDLSFRLLTINNDFVEWTLQGPKADSKSAYVNQGVVVSTKSNIIYKLQNGKIESIDKSGAKHGSSAVPQNLPEISWGTDITYDSKRDLLSIISFGGEGYLYRYFPAKDAWLDAYSAQNHDINSIFYDETMDRYVGWSASGEIVIFSGEGAYLKSKRVADKLVGYGRIYDRNNYRASPLKVIANGDSIALIAISGRSVTHIWSYDVSSDRAILTYKASAN